MSKVSLGSDPRIDQIFQSHFAGVGQGVRPTQRKIIESVLAGNNTLGLMPTGFGKSLCYWIAGKALGGVAVAIFPLVALMDEQAQKLAACGCKVVTLHGGIDYRAQYKELIELYNDRQKPDFIFLSPERLATDGFLEFVLQSIRDRIKLVVVDEAHCISQWGLDFRPFYGEIPHFLRAVFGQGARPPVLCLTATLNPKDREQICRDFAIEESNVIRHDILLRPEIDVQIVKVRDEDTKDERFWAFLESHRDEKVLVYLDRKHRTRSTEDLCAKALERGFKAAFFHGELTSQERQEVIARFKAGELLTVFATSAFGMGIDIPDIRGAVHYLLTESAEQYYQQIGRVGRDGKPSWAVLFYSDKNIEVRQTWYIDSSFPGEKDLRAAFATLSDNQVGRRTVNYFDEGDKTQSGYHYLVRSSVIAPVCKGIQSLDAFEPAKSVSLPEFQAYRQATRTGLLIPTAARLGQSEPEVLKNVYRWLAEGRLKMARSPGKCLVLDSTSATLPDDLLEVIEADVAEKKAYRTDLLRQFVALLEGYTNAFEFHQQIGEYLGIDKFSRQRIHQTLSGDLVRSKSEVIIANILYTSGVPFDYECPLTVPGGSTRVPDFTIRWAGKTYFWEHLGMLHMEDYRESWEQKEDWYRANFPGQLITTRETPTLSQETKQIIETSFGVRPADGATP